MNRKFDEDMRLRAAKEQAELTPQAQEHFRDAIESARAVMPKPDRATLNGWKLAALPWVAVGVIMLLLIPRQDVTDQGRIAQMPQEEISATMTPVTQPQYARAPQVRFDASMLKEEMRVDGNFQNDTQDIWLVGWKAQISGDHAAVSRLLWLEPGAECEDSVMWQPQEAMEVSWEYTGWRVTAKMLHWVEGDVLTSGAEGYEEQQALMCDAMDAGALILAAGEWENGKAGAMQLPLPEGCGVENALLYYEEKGMLEDGSALCSGSEKTYFSKENF